MKFRHKLLLAFTFVVLVCVVAVASIISALAKRTFEQADQQRTAALVAQFHREFDRRGEDIVRRVDAIAKSDAAVRLAMSLNSGPPDYGAHLNDAKAAADNQMLDFLEFVENDGTILSSAAWPAKFGYKESFVPSTFPAGAFLNQEHLPEGTTLSLSAVSRIADSPLYVIGGRKLDRDFLATLDPPAGMRAFFYQNLNPGFSPQFLVAPAGLPDHPELLAPLVERVQARNRETTMLIHWSSDAADDESVDAIPLAHSEQRPLGILLVANSRRPYVDLQQHIRSAAFLSGAAGMLLAIVLSGWVSSRITRPVEQLAQAAKNVAAGDWDSRVTDQSRDEIGQLAQSFNQMTRELLTQRERLVRAERIAAWRELARRLAHELKNPLFPLQLTVENLIRARQQSPDEFDEIFREGSATLLAEITNLKAIVSRFSEFSRMPVPQFQSMQLNDLVQETARLFQTRLTAAGQRPIECRLELASSLEPIAADPELLHRVLSNLISNAIEAMPDGGTLILRTLQESDGVLLEVSDSGVGLTEEERERLFTPYFTTKPQGTGLGLVIAQSIVNDHGGRIRVHSKRGEGTTLSVELPRNREKLVTADIGTASARY
jgi:two-component system, NtrC family, nitrogen regulation sensor histidine kinase NtrY